MDGVRHAESGNFPLGQLSDEFRPISLRELLAHGWTLGKALSRRAADLGVRHLHPKAVSAALREVSWQESQAHVRRVATELVEQRHLALPALLAQVGQHAPTATERLRVLFPSLPWAEPERDEASEPAFAILGELDELAPEKQVATARNVALLWDCFVEEFGGVAGFLASGATEQAEYLDKLEAAASRMEAGRGTPVAYHYVSVVLIKLYVESFRTKRATAGAIALSGRVAALINQGRIIRAQQSKSPIVLVPRTEAIAPPAAPVAQVEVEKAPSPPTGFRVGYVSQPPIRIGF